VYVRFLLTKTVVESSY